MKKIIVKLVCFAAYYTGLIHLCYYLNRKKSLILVYHNVIPDEYWDDKIHLSVSIKQSLFERHLSIINKRLKVSTQLHEAGSVMITFDDGYSNAVIASKCLDKHNNKAVFFVPINNVGAVTPLWNDKIWMWFSYVPEGVYLISGINYSLRSNNERSHAFSEIINLLFDDYNKKRFILDELDRFYSFDQLTDKIDKKYFNLRFKGLSELEVQDLKDRGFKIGGHSMDHDILSVLSSDELSDDFQIVSNYIGSLYNIDLYAYPYGHPKQVSRKVIQECRRSGFTHAVMNEEYIENMTEYTLPRMSINSLTDRYEIEAKLSGFISMCHKLRIVLYGFCTYLGRWK